MLRKTAARFGWNGALVAIGLAMAPVTAIAQDEAPEPVPDAVPPEEGQGVVQGLSGWNKFCNPDPVTQERGCVVVFQAIQENGGMVAQVALSFLEAEPGNIILSMIVPTGVLLVPGIQLQVDSNEPTTVPYVICEPTLCRSERQVETAFVNQLKAGGELIVSFLRPDLEAGGAVRIDVPVTLIGFTAAYDGPGRTPEEAQALQDRTEEARQRLIEQQQQLNENP